jgi:Holliday junction resolvasome RuvABC ATP-dependent DNA helicase subunit
MATEPAVKEELRPAAVMRRRARVYVISALHRAAMSDVGRVVLFWSGLALTTGIAIGVLLVLRAHGITPILSVEQWGAFALVAFGIGLALLARFRELAAFPFVAAGLVLPLTAAHRLGIGEFLVAVVAAVFAAASLIWWDSAAHVFFSVGARRRGELLSGQWTAPSSPLPSEPHEPAIHAVAVAQEPDLPVDVPALPDEAEVLAKARTARDALERQVIGQQQAVDAVVTALARAAVPGMRDPQRPIASFLCAGPTGVGKTEVAKALALHLFDDKNALVRIDCSELMDAHMVARLIGAPKGYRDSEQGGALTEAVRRQPFSVVLIDEIEKAHPRVMDLFLQVLDDGRLTDGTGNTVAFNHTILIFTSNLSLQAMERELRPEFRNRFDEVIVFKHLGRRDVRAIADKLIPPILTRLREEAGLTVTLSESAFDQIAKAGYDPEFGARPLRRAIQRLLENPIAEMWQNGEVSRGDDVLASAGDEGDNLCFTVSER